MKDNNKKNPLWQLLEQGQSIWLDSIQRGQIKSGELKRMLTDYALRGETANPSIFEKAISGSADYDAAAPRPAPFPSGLTTRSCRPYRMRG